MQKRNMLAAGGAVAAGALVGAAKVRSLARRDHVSESAGEYDRAPHRILILGAGFGGLATALALDRELRGRPDVNVLVVDRGNGSQITPLLWTIADGRSNPSDVVVPIRAFQRGRRFHVVHATVEKIDLDRRTVTLSSGVRPYDQLVIALGSVTSVPDLPGLREHAKVFHTSVDALELRNHIIDAVELAHQIADPAARSAWLTFVVGGGGDTGIELAAAINDYIETGLIRQYPWLIESPVRIVVVGRADRLVPMADERTSARVEQVLEASGIEVWTGVSVEGVTEDTVRISRGDLPARTLFWAAGIAAPPVVRTVAAEHASNGSLIVDDRLRLPAHPEVYAIGDAAWAFDAVSRAGVPPTAQGAQHEGPYVAAAIAARLAGKEPPVFRYRPLGHLALLGHHTGVARIGPVVFSGWPAWFVWHNAYLLRMPSWRNRINLVADWTLSGLLGRTTAQLPIRRRV